MVRYVTMKSLESGEYRRLTICSALVGATLGATAMGYVRYETTLSEPSPTANASPQGIPNRPPGPLQCKSLQDFTLTTANAPKPRHLSIKQPAECDQFKLPAYDLHDLENPVTSFANGAEMVIHCAIFRSGGSIIETDSHGMPLAVRVSAAASQMHAAELQNFSICPDRPS